MQTAITGNSTRGCWGMLELGEAGPLLYLAHRPLTAGTLAKAPSAADHLLWMRP